jgi:NRAMP (natural resistance-associated macrophage protein)-like metal ion transporter
METQPIALNPAETSLKDQGQQSWLKNSFVKLEKAWQKLGPGLVTGASDDDPSGIATYTQSGAMYGLNVLWTAMITFPLMSAVQEMCGRLGLVTNHGIAGNVKRYYPKPLLYFISFLTVPASILNIAANLAAMGAVVDLMFPAVPVQVFTILAAVLIISCIVFLSYKRLESVLKWLTLVLLLYLVVPFLVKQNLGDVLAATVTPYFEFTPEYIGILVAILGTTISPYLFFWQASMEVEQHVTHNTEINKPADYVDNTEVKDMQRDNLIGMFFSNFVMYFIILTAASVLFKNGLHQVATVSDAANALRPIAGDGAYLLFAVGIIGTGLLSIPVLAGACSYILSETFNWENGMNKKLHEARGFYVIFSLSIIFGLVLNFIGIDPVQSLLWTATLYGIISPVLIGVMIHMCNRQDIMGKYTNGKRSNILGGICFILMTIAVIAFAVVSFRG